MINRDEGAGRETERAAGRIKDKLMVEEYLEIAEEQRAGRTDGLE